MIKFYRKIAPGINPEIEIGNFLTNEAHFPNAPALYGSIHLIGTDGQETALGVAHAWVRNQGDGWTSTLAYLDRFLQDRSIATPEHPMTPEPHAAYMVRVDQLAKRTAGNSTAHFMSSTAIPLSKPSPSPPP